MKASAFAYHDPKTMQELNNLLGSLDNIRILAGGQSLMPMLNMRYAFPDHVIDINHIADLSGVAMTPAGLRIGAMTRQRIVREHPLVLEHAPVLAEALHWVGHVQTRSRGTIGGSLCHLDPAAEQPCIAALYDAMLHVSGPRGARDVAMRDWVLSYMTPNLEPDEALLGLTLPVWSGMQGHRVGHGFHEFARRHGDYAIVAAAALVSLDAAGVVRRASIALAGVDVRPVRLEAAEQALVGKGLDQSLIAEVSAMAASIEMMEDAHITPAYRGRLAQTMTKRALTDALNRATGGRNV
jgi:carbon-monoxide dehydrogenase medium subunit